MLLQLTFGPGFSFIYSVNLPHRPYNTKLSYVLFKIIDVEKMKIKSEEAKGRRQDVPRKHPLNNIEKILLPKNANSNVGFQMNT